MKKNLCYSLFLAVIPLLVACDDPPANERACKTLCADLLDGYVNDTRSSSSCTITDEEQERFTDNCEDDCWTALDYVVDDDVTREARKCLACIHDNLVDDHLSGDLADTRNQTCSVVCTTTGAKQFYQTFYAHPPDETCI